MHTARIGPGEGWGCGSHPSSVSVLQGGEGRAAAGLPGGGAGLRGRNPKAPAGGAFRGSLPSPSPRTFPGTARVPSPPPPGLLPVPSPCGGGWPFPTPHRLAQTQALSGQAKRAELYREEAEALRERAGRLPRLQEELRRCRERLRAAEACQGRLEVSGGRGLEGGACGGAGPAGERVGREEEHLGAWEREAQALLRSRSWPGEMGERVSG